MRTLFINESTQSGDDEQDRHFIRDSIRRPPESWPQLSCKFLVRYGDFSIELVLVKKMRKQKKFDNHLA